MNFDIRQRKVINAKEKQILCLSASGSGKTGTLIARIEKLLDEGIKPKDIIAITFTNMAADEMSKRLGGKAQGMFVGTIHSLANSICITNGIDTDKYIADADFDKIIKKALTLPRKVYPFVKYVFVDEFQDICDIEYSFIRNINTENFYATCDERQAIYGFKGGNVQHLYNMYHDIETKTYFLNTNYRCPPNIIAFADDFLNSMEKISPKSIAAKKQNGFIDECTFDEALEHMTYDKDWSNWAILCRTNNELAEATNILNSMKIPNLSFKKGDLDLFEMERLLKENKVKILTIHSAKGLQFKHVIVTGARVFNEEERKVAYVAATRAEQSLYWTPSIWNKRGKKARHKDRDLGDAGRIFDKASESMVMFE